MNTRSTTPSSKKLKTRVTLVVLAMVIATSVPLAYSKVANADDYDAKISALQQQIDQYQAAAQALGAQADSLQRQLDSIQNEIAQLQAQIDLNQAKYDQLIVQIEDTKKKIATNRDALGDVLADLSIEGNISTLEMLASSKNISDYVDKQTYQSSMRDELKSTISRINTLKKQLETQKQQTEVLLANQKNSRAALDAKRAEQQRLVDQTRGQESEYNQLRDKTKAEQQRIRDAQQAAIAARFSSSGGAALVAGGADANYPWGAGNCPMMGYYSTGGADGNGGDGKGYGCRQCASYAAWRVAREIGMYPMYWGNATNFPASARAAGFATGYSPRAGSLAVMHAAKSGGPEGHVGWVEAVYGDGDILVSQYNYNYGSGWGMYSKMRMSAAAWDEYVYIR